MPKSNEVSLKDALREMLEKLHLKPKLYQNKIEQIWLEKMGTTIAQRTTDIQLRGSKLYLTVDSSSLRQELSYSRAKIAEMLNAELGEAYIDDVIVR
jgi:flagellar motor protein MotB